MEFITIDAEPLLLKGVKKIYYVKYNEKKYVSGIRDAWVIANKVAYGVARKLELGNYVIDFTDNEDIGTDYILYRFRIYEEGKHVASIRIVTKDNNLHMIVVTTSL